MTTTLTPTADLSAVFDRARRAQRQWAESGRRCLRHVKAFRHLLVRDADRLADVISREVGKPPEEALAGEVLPTADACRFLEREAPGLLRSRRVSRWSRPLWLFGQADVVQRRPRGVVGIIGTWNYPLYLNGVQILQALTALNAVLWKPSEVTPRFAELLHELLLEAGFPADLVQRLPATREMGPALAEADVDHVVFTGSAAVGRKLAARLGERLVSSTLELSGCDAQFVLDDADVGLAARAAWFGMTMNRGQTCIAVRRAFVHRSRYDEFRDRLRPLAEKAPPMHLTVPSQARQARQLVDDAVEHGAKLLIQGSQTSEDGSFRPAVLLDATPEMAVCREAAFAPIMAVLPFDKAEEALQAEAQCPYALAASVFTKDDTTAVWIADQLRAGAVTINDVIVPTAHPATPFGGSGASGWGVTQGAEGLLEMTVPRVVSHRGGTFRPHYDTGDPEKLKKQADLLRALLEAGHSPTLGARLRGWWHVIGTARKGL
jgi:acyl-CoA reductase-like NAD-dependent aldehyde dehydrogenase